MSAFTGTLNLQQREAVQSIEGPLLILAGAGTGKTRVITARIAHMVHSGIPPQQILAMTFTNKAAAEMRERIHDMVRDGLGRQVVVGTFHSFCARLLREFAQLLGYKKNFVIYSQSEQQSLIKRILTRLMTRDESADPGKIQARISKAKNMDESLGDPETDLYAAVMKLYNEELRALNAMDFDDLLLLSVRLVENDDSVREQLHQRHTHFMVDEFQDTNALQMRLLKALVPEPHHVCVVGDDDQSIYGWRGAEITNITQFESFFPNPKVVKLEENYRSTTPILHTANSLIQNNVGRRPKTLWSQTVGNDPVRLIATDEDRQEAEMIVEEIEREHVSAGEPWESFAVLFRTNDQSRVLEQQFRQQKIPYRIVGTRSFFDRKEIRDVIAYMRVLHNPNDDISLLRILNTPTRGIGAATAELAREHSITQGGAIWSSLCDEDFTRTLPPRARMALQAFTDLISQYYTPANTQGTALRPLMERLLTEIKYMDHLRKGAKTEDENATWEVGVGELLRQIDEYDKRDKNEGLGGLLDEVSLNDEREDREDISKKKGVCLITLHASKGLEFPCVYLPGLEKDILPHRRAYEEDRVDEERRLFYVGITRAQKRLSLSWARSRTKWGKPQSALPSPFLDELDRQYMEEFDYGAQMTRPLTLEEKQASFADLKRLLDFDDEEEDLDRLAG